MDINSWAELSIHGDQDMDMSPLDPAAPSLPVAPSGGTNSEFDSQSNDLCDKCRLLKQDIQKLSTEHALNYKTLKEKIINTDMLIKKYNSKCQQYESQTKKLEELKNKLQTAQRECSQCTALQAQLKSTVAELEPYKRIVEKAEREKEKNMKVIRDLQDKINASQASAKQHNTLLSLHQKEVTELKKELQSQRQLKDMMQKQENQVKKLQDNLESEKAKVSQMKKTNNQLQHTNERFQRAVAYYERVLTDWDLKHLIKKKKFKSLPSAPELRSLEFSSSAEEMESGGLNNAEEIFRSPLKPETVPAQPEPPASDPKPGNDLEHLDYDLDFIFRDLGLVKGDKESDVCSFFRPISPAISPLPPSPAPPSPPMEKLSDSEDDDEDADATQQQTSPSNLGTRRRSKPPKKKKVPTATLR